MKELRKPSIGEIKIMEKLTTDPRTYMHGQDSKFKIEFVGAIETTMSNN